jgi:hypothetical protein
MRQLSGMMGYHVANKTYIVKFKPPSLGHSQTVIASTVEIHDEHLIFCDSEGKLAALFLLEVVQSWNEISTQGGSSA